jgi:hypothetical protein
MKIRPLGAELFRADGQTNGRTDGQTDKYDEVKSSFSQFSEGFLKLAGDKRDRPSSHSYTILHLYEPLSSLRPVFYVARFVIT